MVQLIIYSTVQCGTVRYSTVLYQRFQRTKGAKDVKGQRVPRVPVSKAQKVYSGAGFCQELISDRACLLKKVHLVLILNTEEI